MALEECTESSSSSADLISATPEYQQGIFKRGMTDTAVKFLGLL
jgi:hypothetical protein